MADQSRVGSAVRWSAVDVFFRHGLSFVVLVVMARLLSPSDFGLMAMLAFFVSVAALLVDSGFSQAIIQRQHSTHVDESTIFFFTLFMGGLIACVLSVLAPWIAEFYGQPVLEQMTYLMAVNVFVNTFATIHTTLLTKELDFKTITKAGLVSSFISGVSAIVMASNDWGVWSLIGQILVSTTCSVIILWVLHPWRPRMVFSFTSLKSYFSYGGFLLWTGVLNAVHNHLYALLIGKMHSVQDVGFFSQAQRLQQVPVNLMTHVVGRVAFPIFSASADDKEKLSRGLRKALRLIMFINIPLMICLMLLAQPLVTVLFGLKWLPAAPVLQVIAVAGLLWPIHVLNLNVLKAQGHSRLNARIQLIKMAIAISLLILASPWGILAIAYSLVVSSVFGVFINTYYTCRHIGYGVVQQFKDIAPLLFGSVPMALIIWAIPKVASFSELVELFITIPMGLATYLLVCKLSNIEVLDDLSGIIRQRQ